MDLERAFSLPDRSFFLLGPRGVGKSHLLRRALPHAHTFDLLDGRLHLELLRDPRGLEARLGGARPGAWVWIDEVQKAPALLDEVHRLIEARRLRFALSGSSARKLFRAGANLLAGRASTRHLEGFTSAELGDAAPPLAERLAWGTLPLVVREPRNRRDILDAYVHTYLREEILGEGLVRKLEPFARFLEVAGMLAGQLINPEGVARDAAVPRRSVDGYYQVLADTLLMHRLPAYQPAAKVREAGRDKWYWFDPGVARAAAGLLGEPLDTLSAGFAFETLVFHELRARARQATRVPSFFHYRTKAGVEIDFVIERGKKTLSRPARVVLLEAKHSRRWRREWEAPMRSLAASGAVQVDRMLAVYAGDERLTYDGIDVLPWPAFIDELGRGKIVG